MEIYLSYVKSTIYECKNRIQCSDYIKIVDALTIGCFGGSLDKLSEIP